MKYKKIGIFFEPDEENDADFEGYIKLKITKDEFIHNINTAIIDDKPSFYMVLLSLICNVGSNVFHLAKIYFNAIELSNRSFLTLMTLINEVFNGRDITFELQVQMVKEFKRETPYFAFDFISKFRVHKVKDNRLFASDFNRDDVEFTDENTLVVKKCRHIKAFYMGKLIENT